MIARVAKRVIMQNMEKKRLPLLINDVIMGASQVYSYNPTSHVNQGVGSGSRIGLKIQNLRMEIAIRYYHMGENLLTANIAEQSQVRILVLKSNNVKVAAGVGNAWAVDATGLTAADIFINTSNGDLPFCQVDRNKWKVKLDRTYSSFRRYDTASQFTHSVMRRRIKIPMPKRATYLTDANDNVLKQSETYIVAVAGFITAGGTESVGILQTKGLLYFTDA